MIEDLRELVTCESPSTDNEALARSAEVVAHLGKRLLKQDPEVIVNGGRTHLRWRFGEPRVVLVGHHDTVHSVGTLARVPWAIHEGVIRGPGCFDMKAGLVLIFHALARLPEKDGVAIVISADEELGSPTARELIAETAMGCRAAFVTEPSADGGALKTARKGIAQYEITIKGRAAHAGLEPERGINTAIELAHQVLALANLADPDNGTTVTPTVLNAGHTVNTVPDEARIFVDTRQATTKEQQRVDAAINALPTVLEGAALEVRRITHAPPMEPSPDLFALAERVCADNGLQAPTGVAVGGASDGNTIAAMGVPTLDGLGAVGGGAHTTSEYVIAGALPRSAALLTGLVAAALAGS